MDSLQIRLNKAYTGLTTSELAKRAGVRRETVWRWETGQPNVSPETAEKLMRALLENRSQAAPAEKSA